MCNFICTVRPYAHTRAYPLNRFCCRHSHPTANALTTLPQETGSLTKLEELLLQENHLKELPTSLGQLGKLRLLNISHNPDLTRLPQSLGRLHGVLTSLICDGVPLDRRPPDLKWLAQQPPGMLCSAVTYMSAPGSRPCH